MTAPTSNMTFMLDLASPSPLIHTCQPPNSLNDSMFVIVERVLRDNTRDPFVAIRGASDIRNAGQHDYTVEERMEAFWTVCFKIAKQIPAMHSAHAKFGHLVHEVVTGNVGDWSHPQDHANGAVEHMFYAHNGLHRQLEPEERVLNLCSFLGELSANEILKSYTDLLIIPCMNLVHAPVPYQFAHPANNIQPDMASNPPEHPWQIKYHISRLWLHIHCEDLYARLAAGTPPITVSWLPLPLRRPNATEWREVWEGWESRFEELEEMLEDWAMCDDADDALTRLRLVRETHAEVAEEEARMAELGRRQSSQELIFEFELD